MGKCEGYMRKTILILGAVGIGAGFLYALGFNRQYQKSNVENGSPDPSEKETTKESVVPGAPALANGESNSDNQQRAASMARIENGVATSLGNVEPEIDDRDTDQFEASPILKNIRDTAFDSSDEKLALALGRPTDEIEEGGGGAGMPDQSAQRAREHQDDHHVASHSRQGRR